MEKVTPGKEVHLADLAGRRRYRVYEERGTASIKLGSVLIARIVPFLRKDELRDSHPISPGKLLAGLCCLRRK